VSGLNTPGEEEFRILSERDLQKADAALSQVDANQISRATLEKNLPDIDS
jgi:hypothetical protein